MGQGWLVADLRIKSSVDGAGRSRWIIVRVTGTGNNWKEGDKMEPEKRWVYCTRLGEPGWDSRLGRGAEPLTTCTVATRELHGFERVGTSAFEGTAWAESER